MSDGNRRHYLAAALTAISLLSAAYYTMPRQISVGEGQSEEDCSHKTYTMRGIPDGGFEFRVARDEEACEHESAAEQDAKNAPHAPRNVAEADLLAQQQMAHWTKWIGVFTAVSLAVLYTTFHATRQAVVETREIGQKQTRAYLAGIKAEYAEKDGKPLNIRLTLKNTGQSPARAFPITPRHIFTIINDLPPKTTNAAVLEMRGGFTSALSISGQTEYEIELNTSLLRDEKEIPFKGEILGIGVQVDIIFYDVFTRQHSVRIDISEDSTEPCIGTPRVIGGKPIPLKVRTSKRTDNKTESDEDGEPKAS